MDKKYREKHSHGTPAFPLQTYSHHDKNGLYFVSQHWHEEIEWIYVDNGTLNLTVHGQPYIMHAGSLCFINSGELHEIHSSGESYHHAIVFRPNLLDFSVYDICQHDFISPVTSNKVIFPPVDTKFPPALEKEILYHMKEIVQLYHSQSKCVSLSIKIHLFSVLELLFQSDNMKENRITTKGEDSIRKIKNVIEYIQQNYAMPMSLDTMSKIAFMSPTYFCHYFRKETGKSPVTFVNEYRIQKAAQLLSETDLQISQIALAVGFDNFSYFIRKFREFKSMTPKAYRNIWMSQGSLSF